MRAATDFAYAGAGAKRTMDGSKHSREVSHLCTQKVVFLQIENVQLNQ
jgi:hypothetical protein